MVQASMQTANGIRRKSLLSVKNVTFHHLGRFFKDVFSLPWTAQLTVIMSRFIPVHLFTYICCVTRYCASGFGNIAAKHFVLCLCCQQTGFHAIVFTLAERLQTQYNEHCPLSSETFCWAYQGSFLPTSVSGIFDSISSSQRYNIVHFVERPSFLFLLWLPLFSTFTVLQWLRL